VLFDNLPDTKNAIRLFLARKKIAVFAALSARGLLIPAFENIRTVHGEGHLAIYSGWSSVNVILPRFPAIILV